MLKLTMDVSYDVRSKKIGKRDKEKIFVVKLSLSFGPSHQTRTTGSISPHLSLWVRVFLFVFFLFH